MSDLLLRLKAKERRGSKPRCHLLTHGSANEVAERLSALAAPFARVSSADQWMPEGVVELEEAQLHREPRLLDPVVSVRLKEWWLPADRLNARTPNFDIASTCTIDGSPGLLLIEAKAHDEELHKEALGRTLAADASDDRKASHRTIAAAIKLARDGLQAATQLPWHIASDDHYQMSNRFAWAWRLTELGIPVVLVYLGFLKADEMDDRGKPLTNSSDWERLVKDHSQSLFPAEVWGQRWTCGGQAFIPLIRSIELPLDSGAMQ